MSGWIRTARAMWEHPIFKGSAIRVGVWDWMLKTAAWKETKLVVGGSIIEVSRGQLCVSQGQVCEATGMSRQELRTFLRLLVADGAIVIESATNSTKGRSLITICNYDKYQEQQPNANQTPTKRQPTKERREQVKEDTPQPPKGEFEEFWSVFPHRNGRKENKKGAEAKFAAAIKRGVDPSLIIAAAKAYAQVDQVKRGYGRGPVPWLNQEGWKDEGPQLRAVTQTSDAQLSAVRAEWIRSGKEYLTRNITATQARELIEAGLVTQDECRRAGIV